MITEGVGPDRAAERLSRETRDRFGLVVYPTFQNGNQEPNQNGHFFMSAIQIRPSTMKYHDAEQQGDEHERNDRV